MINSLRVILMWFLKLAVQQRELTCKKKGRRRSNKLTNGSSSIQIVASSSSTNLKDSKTVRSPQSTRRHTKKQGIIIYMYSCDAMAIKIYQRISVLSCFTVASAKPAVSDFRGGLSIPGTNGPGGGGGGGGGDAFVKMPSAFECLTAMCIIITNPESSAKILFLTKLRGDCLYRAWTVPGDHLFPTQTVRGYRQ